MHGQLRILLGVNPVPDLQRCIGWVMALRSVMQRGIGVSATAIDSGTFRQVLGSYPTGVCVISAMDAQNRPVGMVVGTFTSVSLDPPLVGFLPDKKSGTWAQIESAGRFCVNVLGSDQQEVCRQIAGRGPDKFEGVDFAVSEHGVPAIAGAIATIDCAIHAVLEAGDHWFVLGAVLAMETPRVDDPMLFHRGRYGGFAELA